MLLELQADESLLSYVKRTLFLNWNAPGFEVFQVLAKCRSLSQIEVKAISSAMGWPGCYGFNRLIHHHTLLAARYVIKNDQNVSYSDKQYVSSGSRVGGHRASFCSDCVKEDLVNLGSSYWRRYWSSGLKACYKHNTMNRPGFSRLNRKRFSRYFQS